MLRRALQLGPDSVAGRYCLAQALAFQWHLSEAARLLDEVIKLAPASEYARMARGVLPELTATAATTTAVPKTQRWNLYGRAAAEHDDNVPLAGRQRPRHVSQGFLAADVLRLRGTVSAR